MPYQARLSLLYALIGMMLLAPCALRAETRIALVIGNGAYEGLPALPNPPNDARLIGDTLRQLDFEVLEHIDVDQHAMKRAIQDFGQRLEAAGADTVGLFYFAGHGVQAKGVNYLIPTAARIEREPDLEIEAIPLDWVLAQAEAARNRMNILILDACRDNPISRSVRSATRGFTAVDAPRGTLIAYATSPGDVALDGTGRNSPYTRALAETIGQPGLVAESAFRTVRVKVMDATGERQVPWENSSLTGEFYFNPEPRAVAARSEPDLVPPTARETAGPNAELLFWQSIERTENAALFESYLERFPDGVFAPIARERLGKLAAAAEGGGSDRATSTSPPTPPPPAPAAPRSDPAPRPEERVALAPVVREPPAAFRPADLAGRWQGSYRCQQDTIGMALDLSAPSGGQVRARFEFFPTGSAASFQGGSFEASGRFDPSSRQLRLDAGAWIDRSWGFQKHDLAGEVQADGRTIVGRILTPGCRDFQVRRAG